MGARMTPDQIEYRKQYPITAKLEDQLFHLRRQLGIDTISEPVRVCNLMIEAVGEYEHGSADLHAGNGSIQLGDYAAVVSDLVNIILHQS